MLNVIEASLLIPAQFGAIQHSKVPSLMEILESVGILTNVSLLNSNAELNTPLVKFKFPLYLIFLGFK